MSMLVYRNVFLSTWKTIKKSGVSYVSQYFMARFGFSMIKFSQNPQGSVGPTFAEAALMTGAGVAGATGSFPM